MTTVAIRQKLMTYLADADDSKVKALYTLLEKEIQEDGTFSLTDQQLQILEKEREMHISGKSKSYSREEANQIIKPRAIGMAKDVYMEVVEENIKQLWDEIENWMNTGYKLISSEKSIVFNFAWEFQKKIQHNISLIDFETSLFDGFSDGQFLDLFIIYKCGAKEIKIGIEFKYPNKKVSNSNQTVTRQKIINDIKRLTWLVNEKKIDLGCFLCVTNENGYINNGRFKVAPTFLTHHGHTYRRDISLPENEFFKEKVKAIEDINFRWKNIYSTNSKYSIRESKYAFLEPIFIRNFNTADTC